jgi:hypothetical protein
MKTSVNVIDQIHNEFDSATEKLIKISDDLKNKAGLLADTTKDKIIEEFEK